MPSLVRQLAAIMFTDIVGYTALMGRNEDKGLALLKKNREIHKPLIEKYHGKWVKEMGDGVLAKFDSAYNAVLCAIEIQKKARKELKGQLRIGLHLGEIIIEDEDIFGDGVNIASRIESLTDPGAIYLSEAMQKALNNHADIHVKYLGEVSLKNVYEPVKIYYVAGEHIRTPSQRKIKQLRRRHDEETSPNKRVFRSPIFYTLIALFFILLVTLQYWYEVKTPRVVEAIAVLPFANFTGSEDEQYFVDMMHDAVITELSKIGELIVISRTSTLQFRDTELTIPDIARMLDVDAIIESSVFKTGDSVYMNVQLIKARPKEDHIWADDFESDTRHILSLYGELAKTIAKEVEVQITAQEEILLTHAEEVDPEVYKLYMQGQYHWKKLTKKGIEISKEYFDMVLEKDANNALAHAGISIYYVVYAQMGHISYFEAAPKAKYHADRAIELNNMLAEVHNAAAFSAWLQWDWERCLPEYRKTLEINPNFALMRAYISEILLIMQYPDEGIKDAEFAIELDPFNDTYKALYGKVLWFTKRYDEAEFVLNEALEESPNHPMLLSSLRSVYHLKKMYPEALEMWKDSYRIKNDSIAVETLSNGYVEGGYKMALQRLAELLTKRLNNGSEYVPEWNIATLYTRAGKKEEALLWLEKAYESHALNMPYIRVDPIFDFMRDDPQFRTLMKKVGFPG